MGIVMFLLALSSQLSAFSHGNGIHHRDSEKIEEGFVFSVSLYLCVSVVVFVFVVRRN